jgi:type I restriction enzyme, S subunit
MVCGQGLVPDFLYFYLMSQYARLRQSGFDGQISHLNLGFLRRLLIPRPQTAEQVQIAKAFGLVEAKEQRHSAMVASLNDLFRSLLHQLMTAQVRVRDLDLSALGLKAEDAATDNDAATARR